MSPAFPTYALGMALDFESTHELPPVFAKMIAAHPGIDMLVLADRDGEVVLAVGRKGSLPSVMGKTLSRPVGEPGQISARIGSHDVSRMVSSSDESTLYVQYTCRDSDDAANGTLLAFLDWRTVKAWVTATNADLRDAGYEDTETILYDLEQDRTLARASTSSARSSFVLEPRLRNSLARTGTRTDPTPLDTADGRRRSRRWFRRSRALPRGRSVAT